MLYFILNIVIILIVIVLVFEISKKNSVFGAVIGSIPIITVLSMIWPYIDIKDIGKIKNFSFNIFWIVIPSLVLFISLPILINNDFNFWFSLAIAIFFPIIFYILTILILSNYGINLYG